MIRELGQVKTDAAQELGQVKTEAEANISPLLSGILQDSQTLFRQEVALAKSEIKTELVTAKEAALGFGVSAFLGALTVLMLSFGLVHFVTWATGISLGASYGIVGLLYGLAAGASFFAGKKALKETDFVPHQTIQTMKENVQWIAGT
jgi:hypothetical protein